MKEKQFIKKLHLLRSVQPDTQTLHSIHKRVSSQILPKKQFDIRKWLILNPVIPMVAFAAIVLFFIVVNFVIPQQFEKAFVYTRIALAPNQYEKAKIAYAYADEQFVSLNKNSFDNDKIVSLTQSLALANTQMSDLKLIGEKGKYTMQQCLRLYTRYHSSLESMKKEVGFEKDTTKNKQSAVLLANINHYDQQAEKKLSKYKE